jgi:sulfoxide reductase heme-binding subunit YedZ
VLALRAARGGLGANPIEAATHWTGLWALRLLLATLAVTPLRRLFGWHGLVVHRRTLGLAAFAYATAHFTIWAVLDLGLDGRAIVEDVAERPYVTVGLAGFLLLVPLAITSTRGWMRRLGRRWVRLHRLAYVAAGLAILHYAWLVKLDVRPPLAYAAVLALLIAARGPLPRLRRAAR